MLGLIVAYLIFVGLLILKIPFSPVLAILAGIGELIPTLGPWFSGAIVTIITLAVAPDKVIWVIVLFLAVQLLENSLLVPRIQGSFLRIHPALMIFMLVLGAYLAGFWGLLLAGPLTATGAEIYRYVRQCYQDEKLPPPTD
jgi:predicted PurR-regulated permease PerM